MKISVAVLGMGVVGKAQARMFAAHDVTTYDPKHDPVYPGAIGKADFAIVCVGTPASPDGGADLTAVYEAVAQLRSDQPVLIRSTVLPGTTDDIAAGRDGPVAHAPEFLHEREGGQWHYSHHVPWMLLGGDTDARRYFRRQLERVYPGTIWETSAKVAELAKYTANLYWATRVTFVNEMASIASVFGEDWEEIRMAWLMDSRIDPAYTAMEGFPPGFGGRCWPKDLEALIAASEEAGYFPGFLSAVEEENRNFGGGDP